MHSLSRHCEASRGAGVHTGVCKISWLWVQLHFYYAFFLFFNNILSFILYVFFCKILKKNVCVTRLREIFNMFISPFW